MEKEFKVYKSNHLFYSTDLYYRENDKRGVFFVNDEYSYRKHNHNFYVNDLANLKKSFDSLKINGMYLFFYDRKFEYKERVKFNKRNFLIETEVQDIVDSLSHLYHNSDQIHNDDLLKLLITRKDDILKKYNSVKIVKVFSDGEKEEEKFFKESFILTKNQFLKLFNFSSADLQDDNLQNIITKMKSLYDKEDILSELDIKDMTFEKKVRKI